MNADGSSVAQLTNAPGFDQSPTWSPDGASIAFSRYNAAATMHGWDIAIVSSAGGAPVMRELPGDQLQPAWSPDGGYIAVQGTEVAGLGDTNIYTKRPDGSGLRRRTVTGGGMAPAWITRWCAGDPRTTRRRAPAPRRAPSSGRAARRRATCAPDAAPSCCC
jgi:Tol biopolymer transport system component